MIVEMDRLVSDFNQVFVYSFFTLFLFYLFIFSLTNDIINISLGDETSEYELGEFEDWSALVYCNEEYECQGIYGNTIPTQCSEIYPHSRNGICAPKNCQHNNTDCPIIGDECTSGAILGECDTNSTRCDYAPVMMIAYCIQGKKWYFNLLFFKVFFN